MQVFLTSCVALRVPPSEEGTATFSLGAIHSARVNQHTGTGDHDSMRAPHAEEIASCLDGFACRLNNLHSTIQIAVQTQSERFTEELADSHDHLDSTAASIISHLGTLSQAIEAMLRCKGKGKGKGRGHGGQP